MKGKKHPNIDYTGCVGKNPARTSGGGAVVQVPKKWIGYLIETRVIGKIKP